MERLEFKLALRVQFERYGSLRIPVQCETFVRLTANNLSIRLGALPVI